MNLITNPWINFVGMLLGIFLAVYFYLKEKKVRRPIYFSRTTKWFDDNSMPHDDLSLLFRGRPISRFSITHIAFWNDGKELIRNSDFASLSPLRLWIPEGIEVFDIRIITSTSPELGVSISDSYVSASDSITYIPISFEYFDQGGGFLLQIIHDGDGKNKIEFIGKLPGSPPIREWIVSSSNNLLYGKNSYHIANYSSPISRRILMPIFHFMFGIIGLAGFYVLYTQGFDFKTFIGSILLTSFFIAPFVFWREPMPPKTLCEIDPSAEN